jgi:hypothetical protein
MNNRTPELYIQITDTDGGNYVHSIVWTNSPVPSGFCFKPEYEWEAPKMIVVTHVYGRLENIRHIAEEDLKEELLHWEDKWDYVRMRPLFCYTWGDDRAYDIIHEDDPFDDEEKEPTSYQI